VHEAGAQGISVAVAQALVRVESGGNPRARDAFGSLGLTQIKCATARGLGFVGDCAALFDPAINLKWGLRHARLALDRGSIGFHQTGLHARGVTAGYVRKINAAM
jgi:soluble lytic murein transglycosylase-like protein